MHTQSRFGDSQPGVDQLICIDWKLVDRLLTEMLNIDWVSTKMPVEDQLGYQPRVLMDSQLRMIQH